MNFQSLRSSLLLRPFLYVATILLLLFIVQSGRNRLQPKSEKTSLEQFKTVDWDLLRQLNLKTGQMTDSLAQADGRTVKIAGFMVPLEDEQRQATEFLLVPYTGACIHTPPPPPNQIVFVKKTDQQAIKIDIEEPIWIVGRLEVGAVNSPYGKVSYQLLASRVEAY
jgi:uncharacterized protein